MVVMCSHFSCVYFQVAPKGKGDKKAEAAVEKMDDEMEEVVRTIC